MRATMYDPYEVFLKTMNLLYYGQLIKQRMQNITRLAGYRFLGRGGKYRKAACSCTEKMNEETHAKYRSSKVCHCASRGMVPGSKFSSITWKVT